MRAIDFRWVCLIEAALLRARSSIIGKSLADQKGLCLIECNDETKEFGASIIQQVGLLVCDQITRIRTSALKCGSDRVLKGNAPVHQCYFLR